MFDNKMCCVYYVCHKNYVCDPNSYLGQQYLENMKVGYWVMSKIWKGKKTCSHILGDNEMTIVYSPNKDPSRGI